MNKKGSAFPALIIIIAIAALVWSYQILISKDLIEKEIGDEQLELFEAYSKGEGFILYTELAGKYAAEQTVQDLAEMGGIAAESECGKFKDYNLWNLLGKECKPDPVAEFEFVFNNNLIPYILSFQEELELEYNLEFDEKWFIAKPKNMTNIIILKEEVDEDDKEYLFVAGNEIEYTTSIETPDENICEEVTKAAIRAVERNCPYVERGDPDMVYCEKGLNSVDFNNFALTQINTPQPKISGPAKRFCEHGNVYDLTKEIEKNRLEPGSFVSVTYPGEKGEEEGHTAVYIGKGEVNNPDPFWMDRCFTEFIPDDSGEQVFASSIGWVDSYTGLPVGRSCFTPASMFFSFYSDPTYCSLNVCDNSKLVGQSGPKTTGDIPDNAKGVYSIYPSFKVELEYDFEEYGKIWEDKELFLQEVNLCKFWVGTPGGPPNMYSCIISNLPDDWNLIEYENNYYAYEVESKQEIQYYDSQEETVSVKPIKYRFALHILN